MEFLNFDLAKKLKEKGFDWVTSNVYERNTIACRYEDYPKPTISQVLKWLREEKKIAINIEFIPYAWQYKIIDMSFERRFEPRGITLFSDYEEAAIAGIEYVLDNIL